MTGECAEMVRAMSDAVAESPDAELAKETTYAALMARSAQLDRRGGALIALRDRLASPLLATRTNDFAQATFYLAYLAASRAGATQKRMTDLSSYDRGLYIATRERELARRAALAECTDDGSREQSAEWKEATKAKILSLRSELEPCFRAEARAARHSSAVSMKLRIAPDGHVITAGPDTPYELPGGSYTAELAYCVMNALEKTVFPAPRGEAIVVVPFEHDGT